MKNKIIRKIIEVDKSLREYPTIDKEELENMSEKDLKEILKIYCNVLENLGDITMKFIINYVGGILNGRK